jgi:hypothetical protein
MARAGIASRRSERNKFHKSLLSYARHRAKQKENFAGVLFKNNWGADAFGQFFPFSPAQTPFLACLRNQTPLFFIAT